MDEFPGDKLAYVPWDQDDLNLPRSPAKVLNDLGHDFRVGINGFGPLGRAVFCKAYGRPFIEVATINDPNVDALHAASILKEEQARGRIGPTDLDIFAEAPNVLKLRDPATSTTRTVYFRSESDPSRIIWQDPEMCVFYVIECSGRFTTVEQAFAHIQIAETHYDDVERGALKVLIASSATDAPRFYPGINVRDIQVEDSVFACAPPEDAANTDDNGDVWQYSSHVLDLLSLVLARDGAAAVSFASHEGHRGEGIVPRPGEESPFVGCLRMVMAYVLPPHYCSDPYQITWWAGWLEMGNTAFMPVPHTCKCNSCPGAEAPKKT